MKKQIPGKPSAAPFSSFVIRHSSFALILCLATAFPMRAAQLTRLTYNNPGLTVDLGVGLWAWPVPCDADGDGDNDLVVSCPDKPYNGVWLFENTSGPTRTNKMPVFKPARRLGKAAHYVTPSYVGGALRVLTPGLEYPAFLKSGLDVARRLPAPSTREIHTNEFGGTPGLFKIRHNQWRFVDYDGDGALDLTVAIEDWSHYGWDDAYDASGNWLHGPLHGIIHVLHNTGSTAAPQYDKPFLIQSAGKPLDVFGCPSPNFADFDGDGDLDLITGEFRDGFTYFENTATRTQPRYAGGRRLQTDDGARLHMDLEMIVPVAFDWDGDGDLDLIVGDEDGRVAFIENTGRLAADRTPQFLAPRYFQQEADILKCGALATPFVVDWDGDGDQDIVSGNTAGYIEFFQNLSGPKTAEPKWAAPSQLEVGGKPFRIMAGTNGSIQGPAEAKWGYTTLNVADWDGDGLPDIVFNSILGRVEWLRNLGPRDHPKLAPPQPVEVAWTSAPPKLAWGWMLPQGNALLTQWRTTPLVFDFNRDGLADLAMLDTQGYLAFFERARRGGQLVLLPPRRAFVDEQGAPLQLTTKRAGGSGRRKLCVTDWNGDGKFDLLLNSSNADLLEQTAARDGQWFFKRAGSLAQQNIEGHDVSPAVADFDGDGVPDFLGGAEDGHFYFLKNPRAAKP